MFIFALANLKFAFDIHNDMSNTQFNINNIIEVVDGTTMSPVKNSVIEEFLIDSRLLGNSVKTLFFAIKTDKNNGHKYIEGLFAKGVRNFIVTETELIPENIIDEANVIVVGDAVIALQTLAANYRSHIDYPILGITGSNGKTIVKEWLYQLLTPEMNVYRSPKSFNSQIGVALSILGLPLHAQLGIIEAGISQKGEMERLEKMIRPTMGIITNIGTAHLQNFESADEMTEEKIKLFKNSEVIFYSSDYHNIKQALEKAYPNKRLIGWSPEYSKEKIKDFANLFGNPASVENISHCLAFIDFFIYNIPNLEKRLSEIVPLEMRLELKDGINNSLIINDSYSLDIKSFQIAVGELMQQNRLPSRSVIVSDFVESEESDDVLYNEVADIINNHDINQIFLVGTKITTYADKFNCQTYCYLSTDDFINRFNSALFINQAVLLKGARNFHFERIGNILQQKEHDTVLEINVDTILNNLSIVRNKVKPQTKLLVMVKAFSYGSGSVEIASILQSQKVDYLAVAIVDEGIELRQAGITLPIVVMNPGTSALSAMIKFHLEPEVYSIRKLKRICELARQLNNPGDRLNIHVKVDTGMHRLGFTEEQIPELLQTLKDNSEYIHVSSIFSHLACADMADRYDFTMGQIHRFESMSMQIESGIGYRTIKHILNSYGIALFTDYQFDMVRLGIGLYGAEENLNRIMNLQPALKLKAVVSQVRKVPKGEGVGYGQTWTAQRDSEIAILPIGYADGFFLSLSNSGVEVYIRRRYAPIVGRVCMDMCFADVTGMGVEEGDEVEIFGEHAPLSKLAAAAHTIPYEIISTLSQRIKRIYYQ